MQTFIIIKHLHNIFCPLQVQSHLHTVYQLKECKNEGIFELQSHTIIPGVVRENAVFVENP